MANQRHVDILLRDGIAVWNLWRKEEPDTRPDLSGAHLAEADLAEADLTEADLTEAHLFQAHLFQANLTGAHLRGTHLTEASLLQTDLRRADLLQADLRGSNLTGADLRWADLTEAHLFQANLTGADLRWAHLFQADLRRVDLTAADLTEADLTEAQFTGANLTEAQLTGANLTGANLSRASCLRTCLSRAMLMGCTVYGISVWDLDLEGAVQSDLRITPLEAEEDITVDDLEVAQFLYLLLHNQKLRAILDTITSKVVLILGRFSEERKPILDALREALRHHPNGYIPVLFDFEPQRDRPELETVKTLANLARFVIADLTDPRMVNAELEWIIPNVPTVPVQSIIEGDGDLPTAYASWRLFPSSFLPVYRYADLAQLLASLSEAVITPVEGHVRARRLADGDTEAGTL